MTIVIVMSVGHGAWKV